MTDEEYGAVQDSIMLVSSVVEGLPLAQFLARAEQSLEHGPAADPALYAEAGPKLRLLVATARKLRAVQELNAAARAGGVIK